MYILINKEKALYLLKKIDSTTNIENINDGIIYLEPINGNPKHYLLVQIIFNGNKPESKVIYFVDEKPTIRIYKQQFWVYRNTIKHFSEDLMKFFKIKNEDLEEIREDVFRELNFTFDLWMNKDDKKTDEEPKEVLTEEENTQLTELLENPDFFEIIKIKMSKWCEGNDNQSVFLYTMSYSTYLKYPALVGIIGNSSSGKSHLVKSVKKMFKDEYWQVLASSSSKGFFYDETEWEGQRLFLLEIQGLNDENMVLLRTWWSEGADMSLKHITVDKNEAGQMTGATKELKKPPFGIFTSAVPEVENQMSTRIWRVHADDSLIQHKNIKSMIAENVRFNIDMNMDEGIPLKIFHHIEESLDKDIEIIIPYAHDINLSSYKFSRANRDIKKLYNAIKCFALLSQKRRLVFELRGKKYLISEYEDYANFLKYGGLIFSNTVKDIDEDMRRCIAVFVAKMNKGDGNEINISSMAKELGSNNRSMVKRLLDELHNKNIVDKHKGGRNSWIYSLTDESKLSFLLIDDNKSSDIKVTKSPQEHELLVNKIKLEISNLIKLNKEDIYCFTDVMGVINKHYPRESIK